MVKLFMKVSDNNKYQPKILRRKLNEIKVSQN